MPGAVVVHEVAAAVLPDPDVPGPEIIALPGPIAVPQHRSLILRLESILGRWPAIGIGRDVRGLFDGSRHGGLRGEAQCHHESWNQSQEFAARLTTGCHI